MHRTITALAVCAAAVGICYASDIGTATGKMTVGGKTTELHWAVARTTKNPFHEKQTDVVVLLSNLVVTPEQFGDIKSMLDLADSGRLTGIEVEIDPDKNVISGMIYSPMFKLPGNSFSAVGMHKFEPTTFKGTDVAGKLSTTHESSFKHVPYAYSATFHVVATTSQVDAAPKLAGASLPAGGGEPGKAFLAYSKDLAAGNLAAIKKAVSSTRAKQMDDPEFKEMFPLVQAMEPKKIKITGGAIDGDKATLTATGDSDGAPANGTIVMVRESSSWKVDSENWKSKQQ